MGPDTPVGVDTRRGDSPAGGTQAVDLVQRAVGLVVAVEVVAPVAARGAGAAVEAVVPVAARGVGEAEVAVDSCCPLSRGLPDVSACCG